MRKSVVLVVFRRLAGERARRFSMRMGAAVILKICVGDIQTIFWWVIAIGGQLATEPPRANIRAVLIANEVVIKGSVRDSQRENH
jgi:hypothetical protein